MLDESMQKIMNLLNDDVVLDKPEDSLKSVADDVKSDVLDKDSIKETEFVEPGESKDLVLNKEEYSKGLRSKLYPVNQGISTSPVSDEERKEQHENTPKNSLAFLKEKLQGILKELEEIDEEEEKLIDEEAPTAAGIAGPGTTSEAIAPFKEKIGASILFKRKP